MAFSQYTLFISLLSIFSVVLPMDPPMDPPVERHYPLDFQPMGFADDPNDERIIEPHPITITNDNSATFEGMAVEDLKMILENAPEHAQFITEWLQNKKIMDNLDHQSSFIIGDHGCGKTVLAKAIAHKLCSTSDWSYEYISSRAFMGKHRNETGVALRTYLQKIAELKQPTLLIIDQLNKILEYTESSADDTSFASGLICNFIDKQTHNRNLFLLGLMDRATKLENRLKQRMGATSIWVEEPSTPEQKRIIFASKCINPSTQFHPEVTNEWLEQYLENNSTIRGRNYRGLALHIQESLDTQEKSQEKSKEEADTADTISSITKDTIETALKSYLDTHKDTEDFDPYENYRDRQERLHTEGLFNQFLPQNKLPLLEDMLDHNTVFTSEQCVLLRKMLKRLPKNTENEG